MQTARRAWSGPLIRKAFAELGAQRVFAETMAVNTTSRCMAVRWRRPD
ncbi:MAG: hypothetical protein ACRDRY_00475 [Pseudonocardiaceae bacterium]